MSSHAVLRAGRCHSVAFELNHLILVKPFCATFVFPPCHSHQASLGEPLRVISDIKKSSGRITSLKSGREFLPTLSSCAVHSRNVYAFLNEWFVQLAVISLPF